MTASTTNCRIPTNMTSNSSDRDDSSSLSPEDHALLQTAREHLRFQRYLRAAHAFEKVSNPRLLSRKDRRCLSMAHDCQAVLDELTQPPIDEGNHAANNWIQQEETHSDNFDAQIFFKVDNDHVQKTSAISCRIESPIDESLLAPLLAVLNESEFYTTWMPNWKHPVRLGVKSSEKLREIDKGNQLIAIQVNMPFPFNTRECVMHAFSVDDIDDSHAIIIKVKSVDTDPGMDLDDKYCGSKVSPTPDKGVVRVDFDAGFLIRKCPPNHTLLQSSKHTYKRPLLLSVTQQMNSHVGLVPMSLINFFTKSVIGKLWQTLLTVAQEIRDGQRPEHAAAIEKKKELYEWIQQRVDVLLSNNTDSGLDKSSNFCEVSLESTEFHYNQAETTGQ